MKILTSYPFSLAAYIPAFKAFFMAVIPLRDLQETLKLAIVLMTGRLNLLLSSCNKHYLIF
jgi:hypothetical protein